MTGAVGAIEEQSVESGRWAGVDLQQHGTVSIQAWVPDFLGDEGRNGQVFLINASLWSLEWNLIFLNLG